MSTHLRRAGSAVDGTTGLAAKLRTVGVPDLESLYVEHGAVFEFFRNRAGRQEAEDLTSEVFVRVARALPKLEDRGVPMRAWILRIARNLLIDQARTGRVDATRR